MTDTLFPAKTLLVYPPTGLVRVVEVGPAPAGMGAALFYQLKPFDARVDSLLYVSVEKATKAGLRPLSPRAQLREAVAILQQCKRFLGSVSPRDPLYSVESWKMRLSSGSILDQARLLRDFHRNPFEPPFTYAERQLYNEALTRMAQETGAILRIKTEAATEKLIRWLSLPRQDLPPSEEALRLVAARRNPAIPTPRDPYSIQAPQSRKRAKKTPGMQFPLH